MVGFFGAMHFHDTEQTRMYFFIAFLVNPVVTGVAVIIDQLHLGVMHNIRRAFSMDKYAEDACEKMPPDDFHKLFKSMKQCVRYERGMMNMIFLALAVLIVLSIALYIHFALVLYTHWKNANKTKEEGGVENYST